MLTVTFYSFRGGVGRTMALANAAAHLAREGMKVALIDFDLEAPGLSLMPDMQPAQTPDSNDGLLGYLRAGLEDRSLPSVASLCYETKLSAEIRQEQSRAGSIYILPAGTRKGSERQYDLAHLHLDRLYQSQPRSLVIDALKVQIEQEYAPDYLLVDSRTGFTEVGGICTVHLADLLVIVSGLNRQNVDGTSIVLRNLCQSRKDLAQNTLFVISPVPAGEEALKAERLKQASEQFAEAMEVSSDGIDEFVTVPYHPQIALTEDSFVVRHPQSPLAHSFRQIAEAIRNRNPAESGRRFLQLLERFERDTPDSTEELSGFADEPGAPRNALLLAAALRLQAGDYQHSRQLLERLLNQNSHDADVLSRLGTALALYGRTRSGVEAEHLFAQASEKFAEAVRVNPDEQAAWCNWGNVLLTQARTKSGEEADALFARTGEKYAEAVRIKPDDHDTWNNWGTALLDQARTKSDAEADELFAQAGEKYAEAVRIKPDDHDAWNNWGNALLAQAKTKTGAEADALFAQAGEKLKAAEQIHEGAGAYNLACVAALRGDIDQCRSWLEKSRAAGRLPSRQHLLDDDDLDSVRQEDWFAELLSSLDAN